MRPYDILIDLRKIREQNRAARTEPHSIVNELRRIRRDDRISQEAIGAAVGLNALAITQYEMGYRSPKIALLCDWADFLGLELVLRPKKDRS